MSSYWTYHLLKTIFISSKKVLRRWIISLMKFTKRNRYLIRIRTEIILCLNNLMQNNFNKWVVIREVILIRIRIWGLRGIKAGKASQVHLSTREGQICHSETMRPKQVQDSPLVAQPLKWLNLNHKDGMTIVEDQDPSRSLIDLAKIMQINNLCRIEMNNFCQVDQGQLMEMLIRVRLVVVALKVRLELYLESPKKCRGLIKVVGLSLEDLKFKISLASFRMG